MTTATLHAPARDAEAFAARMLDVINYAGLSLMIALGHRTGLFDAMAGLDWATSGAIAGRAALNERYVREWLGALVTAGVVEYDPAARTYWLPPEHAACLTRAAVPGNIAATMQWVAVLAGAEDAVAEAFRHGKGVPYGAYHRFHEVMAEESEQTTVWALEGHILPLVPGLVERLRGGINVLDVGCGSGRALMRMAELFPASRFSGQDFSDEAIALAKAEARRRGLANVRFEARDVAMPGPERAYHLITAFDAVHDQARPAAVLKNIAQALRPGGVFLMQDIAASSHLEGNREHPLGTFLYAISCTHCMSVSLGCGGPGLGATWGKELALRMLAEAGFGEVYVERLVHDLINYYYVARR